MATIKIRKKHPKKTYGALTQTEGRGKTDKMVMSKRGPDMPRTTSQGFTKFDKLPHRSESAGYQGKRSKLDVKQHRGTFVIIKGEKYKWTDGQYRKVK